MKEFFEAFNIEPIDYVVPPQDEFCGDRQAYLDDSLPIYPSITSDIVLGLFKILQNAVKLKYPKTIALEINIDKDFREEVLYGLIQLKNETFDQVRALFNAK